MQAILLSLVPQLALPPPLCVCRFGRDPFLSELSLSKSSQLSPLLTSSHSDHFLLCARQISPRMEGARQIFIITFWALLQSLLPGYHLAYLLSASQIN